MISVRGAEALPFDIADEQATATAIAQLEAGGRSTSSSNNVGQRDRRGFEEISRTDMARLMDVNLVAPFDLARRAAPLLRASSQGRIINITSIASEIARGDASYTASKAALDGLTRALAAELGPDGVTVNAVAPGFVLTEANEEWFTGTQEIAQHLARRTSLGRWGGTSRNRRARRVPRFCRGELRYRAHADRRWRLRHPLLTCVCTQNRYLRALHRHVIPLPVWP